MWLYFHSSFFSIYIYLYILHYSLSHVDPTKASPHNNNTDDNNNRNHNNNNIIIIQFATITRRAIALAYHHDIPTRPQSSNHYGLNVHLHIQRGTAHAALPDQCERLLNLIAQRTYSQTLSSPPTSCLSPGSVAWRAVSPTWIHVILWPLTYTHKRIHVKSRRPSLVSSHQRIQRRKQRKK